MPPPLGELAPEVAAFLARARLGHLATADEIGQPHVVPIVFALLDERLYSPLDAKPKRVAAGRLRRVRNLRVNPRAAVVVDHYSEDWSRLGYVLCTGHARVVDEADEAARARAALQAKYAQYRAGPLRLDAAPVLVVELERVICWGDLGSG